MTTMHESNDLIEIACVELIQRIRRGEPAVVEEYVRRYPELAASQFVLDLIDAEICVRREIGAEISRSHWMQRFPQHADAIDALLMLDAAENAPNSEPTLASGEDIVSSSFSGSTGSDTQTMVGEGSSAPVMGSTEHRRRNYSADIPPMPVPPGFTVDTSVACNPDSRLWRCHDDQDRKPFGYKVHDVTRSAASPLTATQRKWLLDRCEQAAAFKHSVWIPPTIAACDGRYLGIIRPWVFAVPWTEMVRTLADVDVLRLLSQLAFCLHAAHQFGAHHGHVCENNLFVSHHGKLWVTDAAGRFSGKPDFTIAVDAAHADALMFARLLASVQLDPNRQLPTSLVGDCHQMILECSNDRLARVAEWLVKLSDTNIGSVNRHSSATDQSRDRRWWRLLLFRRDCDIRSARPPLFR